MTPPRVWTHLTNAAAKLRDQSAQKLRSAQARRVEAQRKLDALLGYRRDYLANLDRAIEQQTALMSTMQTDVGFAQTDWQHTQRRVDSLQTIEGRRAEIGERIEARRDQKLTDEFALRRNRGGSD